MKLDGGIFLLDFASCFLLAFIVFINPRKDNILANKWLAFFLFTFGIILLDCPITELGIFESNHYLICFTFPFNYIIAPALFLSIDSFVTIGKKFNFIDLFHFTPALFFSIYLVYLNNTISSLDAVCNKSQIILSFTFLQVVIYLIISLKKLVVHQKNIKLFSSNLEPINLQWLLNINYGGFFMMLIWINEYFDIIHVSYTFNAIFFLISIYCIAFSIVSQVSIFTQKPQEIEDLKLVLIENTIDVNSKKQLLTDDELIVQKNKLIELMLLQKPYLDASLSLPKLAEMMQMRSHELSYLINEGFNETFFAFVNRYRVDKSKELLVSENFTHLNMLGIAFESGFNSKTVFNTTFKKITNKTPNEYKQLQVL